MSERRTGTRLGAKEWTRQDLQLVTDRGAVRDYRLRCSLPAPALTKDAVDFEVSLVPDAMGILYSSRILRGVV